MIVFILLIITVIVIGIIIALIIRKTKKNAKEAEKNIRLDDPITTTIHFSDDFKSGEPITTTDQNHTITTILMNKEDSFVWVCPSCETENPLSKQKCCVCHYINLIQNVR